MQAGGSNVDWGVLMRDFRTTSDFGNIRSRNPWLLENIQIMMRDIWRYCHIWSNKNFTMSTKQNVRNYLRRAGLQAEYYDFSIPHLENHFRYEDKSPVIIRGWDNSSAHYWVVDGCCYTQKNYDVTRYDYYGDPGHNYKKSVISQLYYHCVWGWYGKGNGWYIPDCFYPCSENSGQINYKKMSPIRTLGDERNFKPTLIFKTWR